MKYYGTGSHKHEAHTTAESTGRDDRMIESDATEASETRPRATADENAGGCARPPLRCDGGSVGDSDNADDLDGELVDERGGEDIVTDGGEELVSRWDAECQDCDWTESFEGTEHPAMGPPGEVEKAVRVHKNTTDESHIVRVKGTHVTEARDIDPELITDGSGHVCDACDETFETLTRLRLHEKDDCSERAVMAEIDPNSADVGGQAAEELAVCRDCGRSNPNAAFQMHTSFAGDDFHYIIEFPCTHCGFENENRVVMEGVDRDDLEKLPAHLQPDDHEIVTDGGTIKACRNCDSCNLYRRNSRSAFSEFGPDDPEWRCEDCGHEMHSPKRRGHRRGHHERTKALLEADKDTPLTDGGELVDEDQGDQLDYDELVPTAHAEVFGGVIVEQTSARHTTITAHAHVSKPITEELSEEAVLDVTYRLDETGVAVPETVARPDGEAPELWMLVGVAATNRKLLQDVPGVEDVVALPEFVKTLYTTHRLDETSTVDTNATLTADSCGSSIQFDPNNRTRQGGVGE